MSGDAGEVDPRTVWNSLREPVFAVVDGEIVFVNERFLEVSGTELEEVLGAEYSLVDRLVEEGTANVRAAIETVARGGSDEERVEVSMRHPESAPVPRRLPAEARITPLEGYHGGAVVVLRNIVDRKEREAELESLSDEYEAVFENSEDGIFLVDVVATDSGPEFRFERLNPAHESISGMRTEDIRGETPTEALGEETGAEVAANYRRCVEAGEPISYEEVLEMPSGSIVWETKLTPVVVDGTVTRIVGVARDVTERVEQERTLARQKERLEQFASVISHDLRNPLSVAEGRLELARQECDSDHLDEVAASHDRMAELIGNLLQLSRAGEAVAELESVDLAELARDCWRTVETGEASLVVDTDAAVRADPSRLRQLVENLVRNAVEHAGPDVAVRIGDLDDGFFVEDDGPGVPEGDRARVFDSGVSLAGAGAGIGLSIVREVAEAHGWSVRATDGSEGGARFEVTDVERVDR